MHLTYDPHHNVAYIRFREREAGVETLQVSDELNVDMAEDGSVYGIELLNANEQISALGGSTVSLEDTATGRRVEIDWPHDAA